MKSIYDVIMELNSTNSRLDKERILKNNDSELLRKVFYKTYNYQIVFGIKKIPITLDCLHFSTLTLDEAIDYLEKFENRVVTGNRAINFLTEILTDLSYEDAWVFEKIIQKDMDCGVSNKTLNKVFGDDFIKEFPVMLAQPLNDKNINSMRFPCIAQMKADGARINAICRDGNRVEYFSRNGKEIFTSNKILDNNIFDMFMYYKTPFVLDGEIICCDLNGKMMERKISNGIVNKAIKGTISENELSMLNLFVWDIIPLSDFNKGFSNIPYVDRFEDHLRYSIERINNEKRIHMIESVYVNSIEECNTLSNMYISKGYEGIIVKDTKMPWENKRTPNQIKFKKVAQCELEIVDIQEGNGKYEGMVGAFIAASSDRKIKVTVGSGITDKDREEFGKHNIGDIMTVEFNDITSNDKGEYSLFLPRFIEIRFDKDEADNFETIKGK